MIDSRADDRSSPDPSTILAALKTRILAAYIAGRASREIEESLSGNAYGLTGTGMALLHALRLGNKTITEISRYLPVAPSTLVPVVDALEQRGLLERQRDPRDRRRTPLAITDLGRDALATIPPGTGFTAIAEALEAMGPEKGPMLASLLSELVETMGGEEIARGVDVAVRAGLPGNGTLDR